MATALLRFATCRVTDIRPTRILVVDDHAIVRQGLRAVLADGARFDIVAEAADGEAACRLAATLLPDVVLMDLSMPGVNGAKATRRILVGAPATRVIVLTVHEEPPYIRELFAAGARGYVLKRGLLQNLLRAIEVVVDGGVYLDPNLAGQSGGDSPAHLAHPLAELSARESEVALLTAQGHSNAEIAASMKIAVKTVEAHKTRLMSKLGFETRAQLVRYAIYRGWLRP